MEAISLQNGVREATTIEHPLVEHLAVDTPQAMGTTTLGGEDTKSFATKHRHGYRQDSSPELIDLLHRAQTGETEAFADLYRTQVERVTRYVAARMRQRDQDAIPDLVQEAFCEAFADLPAAHHDVTGWFLAHAAKACTRHEWSSRRYIRAAKTVQEEARSAASLESVADSKIPVAIGHLALVHALSRLVPDQRRAVQLRFMDGLPRQTRAEELDRSLVALKALEWRALRNLRAVFQAPQATASL